MNLSISAIEKKEIVLFAVDYQILFVLIVTIIIMIKRFGYVLTIGNNMK